MNRGAVFGIRRTPTDVERGGCAALGAGTTVGASISLSRRCSSACIRS